MLAKSASTDTGPGLLLSTKLNPPRMPAELIERPRLLDLAVSVRDRRLTVVKAGPGFGKTSLVAAWSERFMRGGDAVAWFTIDPDDDEPSRFFFSVSHALRRAADTAQSAIGLISDGALVTPNTVVYTLINELADLEDHTFLVLDDYHWINRPTIHQAIAHLVTYAPERFHVVLTSRAEPPLPLPTLRARNQVLEIDTAALRFDVEEMRRFFEEENLGPLDPTALNTLYNKTEGWPAVLRIIATTCSRSVPDLVAYAGRLSAIRPIGGYLAEMLDGLPPDMVAFMLRIAVLDRFSESLCNAVTDRNDGATLLAAMEARQLLLIPLGIAGTWYRYHPLLGDHLRNALAGRFGDEVPLLHRRAAGWYADRGLWTDAVRHVLAAGDTGQAMSWIEYCAMDMVKAGDLLTLTSWEALFPSFMERNAGARLAIVWGLALAMRCDEALEMLAKIESELVGEDDGAGRTLVSECRTVRAVAIALKDDTETALALAESSLAVSADPWTTNVASNVVRFATWKNGDLAAFYSTPWIPFNKEEERRNVFATVYRLCLHGLAELQQLRLSLAESHYIEATGLARQHAPPYSATAALPAALLAQVRYEQGRLDEAEALVIDHIPAIHATGMLECVLRAYTVLVRVSAWRGHIDQAHALLHQVESLAYARGWARLAAGVLVERLRLHVSQGRITEATACLHQLQRLAADYRTASRCARSAIQDYAALGAVLAGVQPVAGENGSRDAIAALKSLHADAEAAGDLYFAVRAATRIAAMLYALKQPVDALALFRPVLAAAATAGLCQSILDQGVETGPLLHAFVESEPPPRDEASLARYAERLLQRWGELYEPDESSGGAVVARILSPRERDILEQVAQGRSNKEMARALGIAPETVKSHLKHVFAKLGVDRRAQAAALAQSLGIVSRAAPGRV